MPRDSSGIYTLPPGNPVVDGTIIQAPWANTTLADIVVQLNNVLTRDGLLGTNAPFGLTNGTAVQPALFFSSEPQLGMYRSGPGMIDFGVGGEKQFHIETDFAQVRAEFSIATDAASNQDCVFSFYRNGVLNSSVEANAAYSLALYTYVTAPATKIGFLPNEIEQLSLDSTGVGFVNVANTLQLTASTATRATLNIPQGVAPTSPINGDMWMTTTGLFARFNAATRSMAMREAQNTFTAGQKQTMQHNATNAGLRIISAAGNPSSQVDGDVWYDLTAGKLKFRLVSTDKNFVFDGDSLSALTVTGAAAFNGGVTFGDAAADPITFISNTATVPAGGFTYSGGPVTFSNGNALNGGTNVGGILTVTGATALNGGVTLGDAAADPLTINSTTVTVPTGGLCFNGGTLPFFGFGKVSPATATIDAVGTPTSVGLTSILIHNAQSVITANLSCSSTAYAPGVGPVTPSSVFLGAGQGNAPIWIGNYLVGSGYLGFMTNALERMRILADGNVGLGTSTPYTVSNYRSLDIRGTTGGIVAIGTIGNAARLELTAQGGIGDAYINNTGINRMYFFNNGAERMQIDSAGKIGVNGVATNHQVTINWTTLGNGLAVQNAIDDPSSGILVQRAGNAGSSCTFRIVATVAGSISHPTLTTTAYNTSSDRRLKRNVRPVGDVGRIIDNIPVVSFDWKTDGVHVPVGLVAQDVYGLFPLAVHEGGTDANEDPWMIDNAKLVPVLLRELQNLRARVAALETL